MLVTVVIGDLVHSSRIPDRKTFQLTFQRSVDTMRSSCRPLSPFTLSAGDEVEAVYDDPTFIFRDLWPLVMAIHPYEIRFSVALGTVTTAINRDNPLVMDGPAFHLARRGLNELKKSRELLGIWSEGMIDVSLENCAAQILGRHVRSWKPTRWQVLRHLLLGHPPAQIAADLGTSATAVYKNIRAGGVELAITLGDNVGKSLARKVKEFRTTK